MEIFCITLCQERMLDCRDAENWRRLKYCGQSMFDRIAVWDGLQEAIISFISVIGYQQNRLSLSARVGRESGKITREDCNKVLQGDLAHVPLKAGLRIKHTKFGLRERPRLHLYAVIFEDGDFFLRFQRVRIHTWRIHNVYSHLHENALRCNSDSVPYRACAV